MRRCTVTAGRLIRWRTLTRSQFAPISSLERALSRSVWLMTPTASLLDHREPGGTAVGLEEQLGLVDCSLRIDRDRVNGASGCQPAATSSWSSVVPPRRSWAWATRPATATGHHRGAAWASPPARDIGTPAEAPSGRTGASEDPGLRGAAGWTRPAPHRCPPRGAEHRSR